MLPGNTTSFGPWDQFHSYGLLHLTTVAVCALLIAAVGYVGHRLRDRSDEPRWRWALAGFTVVVWIFYNAWWNWGTLDWYSGLPFHVCDVAGVLAPLAILTGNRWLRATLYFWAFTLTLQAFIQPVLAVGPAAVGFWTFWLSHTMIFACAVYDLTALRFRPGWEDFGRAAVVSIGYVIMVTPINLWLGANYGFVGNPPPDKNIPAILHLLGPWPLRVVVIFALVALAFALVLWPWLRAKQESASVFRHQDANVADL